MTSRFEPYHDILRHVRPFSCYSGICGFPSDAMYALCSGHGTTVFSEYGPAPNKRDAWMWLIMLASTLLGIQVLKLTIRLLRQRNRMAPFQHHVYRVRGVPALWVLLLLQKAVHISGRSLLSPSSTFERVEESLVTEPNQGVTRGIDSLSPSFCPLDPSSSCKW